MGIEMENKKELDAESITTVNVKDYPPSEAFTAEPPPAYHRPKSTSVQIARIAAFTVVACSVILGAFILAAAYVNSNSACQQALNEQMARMDELLEERAALGPQYQALVGEGNDSGDQEEQSSNSNAHQSASHHAASQNEVQTDDKDAGGNDDEEGQGRPVHLKLPLQLDFDEIAGALMDRNQRSRLNCVVEKRRADEVVDHQPRTVRLPFGLNLTTDPRYEHVSGERMAIFCESGHDQNQRHGQEMQMQGPTIVQAVPIHMSQMPVAPQPQPQQPQQQQQIPPQLVLQHMTQILMQQRMMEEQRRQQQQQRMEEQQRRQQQQQMIQQHLMAQAAQAAQASQQQQHEQQQASPSVHFMVPLNQPEGRAFQPNGSPMSIHQIPLHAAMAVEVDARDGEQVEIEGRAMPQAMVQPPQHPNGPHPSQRETHLLPIEVIEAGPFQPHQASLQPAPAEGLRPPHERPPIYVVPQQIPQQPPQMPQQAQQEIDADADAETHRRPHYVQPRSIRSVDDVFHKREKRMRRCACDCAC